MSGTPNILTAPAMRTLYGDFYARGANLKLDRRKIPEPCWPLIPYAEFWGVPDDWTRDAMVTDAPIDIRHNLVRVVVSMDDLLDDWLGGPEADEPQLSGEYIAFSAMRIAAYYV